MAQRIQHASHPPGRIVDLGGGVPQRVGAGPQPPARVVGAGGDAAAENMNSLIQRVSIASMEEIERVISELQAMRDSLRAEADRVQRDITNYAGMSQAAMSSMRVIGDSLRQLKAPVPQIKHEAR